MAKYNNLIGRRFGRYTVIEYAGNDKRGKAMWLCKCDCGNERIVRANGLMSGNTKSCGCLHIEMATNKFKTHGLYHTRLHRIWNAMLSRCHYNPTKNHYKDYYGRGITVCNEWRYDFKAFYDWAIKNGYDDNLTIDRIDVNGNYEPSNCRWVDIATQLRNTRRNHYITYKDKTQTLSEWARELGMSNSTLDGRINFLHWDIEKAFTTPVKRNKG